MCFSNSCLQQYYSHKCSADWVHRCHSVRVDIGALAQTGNRRSSLSFADPWLLWLVGFDCDRNLRFEDWAHSHRRLQVTRYLNARCICTHWMDCTYSWYFLCASKGSQQIQSWPSFRTIWDGHSRKCKFVYAGRSGKDKSATQPQEIDEVRNKTTKDRTRIRNQEEEIDLNGRVIRILNI